MTQQTQREAVIAEALTWQKTPFVHQACIKGVGTGCGTFLVGVYGAIGIPVPKIEDFGLFQQDWHMHVKEREEKYLNILLKYTHQVETPQPGDIVLFKMGRVYAHSGIIINWPLIIEARWGIGVLQVDANIDAHVSSASRIFLSPFND